jgi:hypothetical protein
LIAERFGLMCDIGSRLAMRRTCCPDISFDHLPYPRWPAEEESKEVLARRWKIFCDRITREAWSEIAIVTHWGFIKTVTELSVPNGAALRIDPTQPDHAAELVYLTDTA